MMISLDRMVDTKVEELMRAVPRAFEEKVRGHLARGDGTPAQGQHREAATARTTTKRRRRNRNVTRWTLDNQARRPPTWLIEATGLDTKTKLAQRFGIGAKFAMGAPLPKPITVPKAALRAPLKAAARTTKRPQARAPQRYASAQQAAVH